jgi:ribokinase
VKPAIVVVGSLNMDFVVRVPRLAAPGETVLGRDFQLIPGGKGANQACAAGKLSVSSTVRIPASMYLPLQARARNLQGSP